MRKFSRVIRYQGIDKAKCYWVIVLLDQAQLITAYPYSSSIDIIFHALSLPQDLQVRILQAFG